MFKENWGVCDGADAIPMRIGLVIGETQNCFVIQYTEGQLYPEELWIKSYVKIFENPLEAVKYLSKFKYPIDAKNEELIKKNLMNNFPKKLEYLFKN